MKALIQRVKKASVKVNEEIVGEIDQGLLVFLGVGHDDTEAVADKLLQKVLNYRIFADNEDKMNLNVMDIDGGLLVVSQFTIMADTKKGLRPSFTPAAAPKLAEALYQYFVANTKSQYQSSKVSTGKFAADMQVSLVNDGPVTIMLEV